MSEALTWDNMKKMGRFMERASVEAILGPAKCLVPNTHIYYYGKGFFLAYADKKFEVEYQKRIEYGEAGQYLVSIYHYASKELFMKKMRLDEFDYSDMEAFDEDIIDGFVNYRSKCGDTTKAFKKMRAGHHFMYGTSMRLTKSGEEFEFCNRFIHWDNFELFFDKNSVRSKLAGFEYILKNSEILIWARE